MQGYFVVQSNRKLINVSAGEDMAANAPASTPMSTPLEPLHAKVSTWYQPSLLCCRVHFCPS